MPAIVICIVSRGHKASKTQCLHRLCVGIDHRCPKPISKIGRCYSDLIFDQEAPFSLKVVDISGRPNKPPKYKKKLISKTTTQSMRSPRRTSRSENNFVNQSRIRDRSFWGSGWPREPRRLLQKVGGEASHLLEGSPAISVP